MASVDRTIGQLESDVKHIKESFDTFQLAVNEKLDILLEEHHQKSGARRILLGMATVGGIVGSYVYDLFKS